MSCVQYLLVHCCIVVQKNCSSCVSQGTNLLLSSPAYKSEAGVVPVCSTSPSVELLNSCGLHALKKLYFPGYCKYTVILCSISEKTVLELGRLFPTIPVTNDPTSKPTSCDWSAVLSRVWTSLSSPLFLFFIHLPLALFMCTTEINTLNAFQKGLSENVRCCHNI